MAEDLVEAQPPAQERALAGTPPVLQPLAAAERYEHAAVVRDRMATLVRACARFQRLSALTSIDHMVAARPDGTGGWELSVVRRGRLVAAGVAPRGAAPRPYVDALVATAEAVLAWSMQL